MAQRFVGGETPESILRQVQSAQATLPNYSPAATTPTTTTPPTTALPGIGTGTGPLGATSGIGMFGGGPAGLEQLANLVNTINRNAQQQANVGRIPGAAGLEQSSSNLIGEELSGQVPQDVANLLAQRAAERGVATGNVGGPGSNAAYLRALGLTSLGLQQTGEQNLTAALGRNPVAPLFNPASQLLTPSQTYAMTQTPTGGGTVPGGTPRITIPTGGGGGGGGGGYTITGGGGGAPRPELISPTFTETTVGMGPSWTDLFGGGGYGETPTVPTGNLDLTSGYSTMPAFEYGQQPTSSGYMFMGTPEQYAADQDAQMQTYAPDVYEELYG